MLGSGPIGLLTALYLTDLGVSVVCADTEPDRLALAAMLRGRRHAARGSPFGLPGYGPGRPLDALTDSSGPDLVIEATGVPSSLETAVRLVASAGRIVQVGISARTASVPMNAVPFKEIDVLGSRNSLNLIPAGLELLARHRDQARTLMTHRSGFGDLQQAFELMRSRTEPVGKIVVDMPASQSAHPEGTAALTEAKCERERARAAAPSPVSPPPGTSGNYDVVVAAAAPLGLVAAIRAADAGLRVLVAEKAPLLGGTTAAGGGVMWAPNNHLGRQAELPGQPRGRRRVPHRGRRARADPQEVEWYVGPRHAPSPIWTPKPGFR